MLPHSTLSKNLTNITKTWERPSRYNPLCLKSYKIRNTMKKFKNLKLLTVFNALCIHDLQFFAIIKYLIL